MIGSALVRFGIKFVSVLFGKCSTLVATKCLPMKTRLPCGYGMVGGGAMLLGKLPVPGRPAYFDESRTRAYCA